MDILSWNYVLILLLFGVLLGILILRYSKKKNETSLKTLKLLPRSYLIKWFLTLKNGTEVRTGIFYLWCALCELFNREEFIAIKTGWLKFALFFKPETLQTILNSSAAIDKSPEYKLLHPWLGTGLVTSSNGKWRSRRKLLTPTFHFSILKDFIPIFNEHSATLVEKLRPLTKRDWIDVVPVVTLCTLDIICETAMGIRMNSQDGKCVDYVTAIEEITSSFLNRALNFLTWPDIIFYSLPRGRKFLKNLKHVHDFTRKIIKEKKEIHAKSSSSSSDESGASMKRKAFLELLLEHHYSEENFTEEDVREEVDTFMIAGHDTTATAISWTLYCLGLYPEIQENVYRELKNIFQDDVKRSVTSEDLGALNYLDRVIKETMRLYPPVPLVGRRLKETVHVLGNTITPDLTCVGSIYIAHRDKEQFPNPEQFDPDRFLPENFSKLHPYAYIPFSAGPRNCIGQRFALLEVKIVLAHVLRNYEVISLDHRDKIKLMWGFTLRSTDPLRIKFVARRMDQEEE